MLHIPKPDMDARAVFDTCTATAKPLTARTRLQELKDAVAKAAAEYDHRRCQAGAAHPHSPQGPA